MAAVSGSLGVLGISEGCFRDLGGLVLGIPGGCFREFLNVLGISGGCFRVPVGSFRGLWGMVQRSPGADFRSPWGLFQRSLGPVLGGPWGLVGAVCFHTTLPPLSPQRAAALTHPVTRRCCLCSPPGTEATGSTSITVPASGCDSD